MKSLQNCTIFQMQDKSLNLTERVKAYDLNTDTLDTKYLIDDLNVIQKRYTFPLKNKVLADYAAGEIKPIFNKDRTPVPSSLTQWLTMDQRAGKPVCVFNLTLYGIMNKEKTNFSINTRQLYNLMQSATFTLGCMKKWNSITVNQSVLKLGASMYSKIFTKVLDRMFAVNLEPMKSDKIKFISAKFFLRNIMEKPETQTINSIAYSCCTGGTTLNTIQMFDSSFNQEAFKDLESFLNELALKVDGLNTLSVRGYIDSYMRMYGLNSLLALEYFPAFVHMVTSPIIGSHINNEQVIEGLLGKEMDKFYNEISNIVK